MKNIRIGDKVEIHGEVTAGKHAQLTIMTNMHNQYEVDANDVVPEKTMTAEDAWKLAIKLRYMDFEDKVKLFNLDPYSGKEAWLEIMENMTPEAVKEKIDDWEKSREVLRNEIIFYDSLELFVIQTTDTVLHCITREGFTYKYKRKDKKIVKTGIQTSIEKFISKH